MSAGSFALQTIQHKFSAALNAQVMRLAWRLTPVKVAVLRAKVTVIVKRYASALMDSFLRDAAGERNEREDERGGHLILL
jgi:hypothetical protein